MNRPTMDQFVRSSDTYPPVTDELLTLIVKRVLSVAKPLKIVLFGSRARGDNSPDSDIDILIVEESAQGIRKKKEAYNRALREIYPEHTVLVRSLREIEEWKYVPRYIASEALREGRVLYEDRERLSTLTERTDGSCLVAEEVEHKTPEDLARWWFERANKDIAACRLLIDNADSYENACFHAQQAAEKYLKGFLASRDRPVEKTHSLETLIQQCQELGPFPEFDQLCLGEMSDYAIDGRYGLHFHPPREQAEDAYLKACRVREIILAHVPPEARPMKS